MAGKPQPPKNYPQEGSGRPSKFTHERCASIIDAISHRIPYEMAAEAHGITVTTLYEWLKTGREHSEQGIDSPYTVFSEALKRAEMQKVREHTDMIAAKPERWQADAWLLERRWYKYFSVNAPVNEELNRKMDVLIEDNKNYGRKEDETKE